MLLSILNKKKLELHQQLIASTQQLWQLEDALDQFYWQTHFRITERLYYSQSNDYPIPSKHWQSWLKHFEQEHQQKKRCFRSCIPFTTKKPSGYNQGVNEIIELSKTAFVCQRHHRLVKRWRLLYHMIHRIQSKG